VSEPKRRRRSSNRVPSNKRVASYAERSQESGTMSDVDPEPAVTATAEAAGENASEEAANEAAEEAAEEAAGAESDAEMGDDGLDDLFGD